MIWRIHDPWILVPIHKYASRVVEYVRKGVNRCKHFPAYKLLDKWPMIWRIHDPWIIVQIDQFEGEDNISNDRHLSHQFPRPQKRLFKWLGQEFWLWSRDRPVHRPHRKGNWDFSQKSTNLKAKTAFPTIDTHPILFSTLRSRYLGGLAVLYGPGPDIGLYVDLGGIFGFRLIA